MKQVILICILLSFSYAELLVLPPFIEPFSELLLLQNYDSARTFISTENLASRADSLFLEVLFHSAKMADYESYEIDGRQFLILCDSARVEFTKEEAHNRETKLFYYLGTMEGAVGVTRGKRNDFAGALTASNVSRNNLETVLERDSEFSAANFGIGMRNYYSSALFNKIGLARNRLFNAISLLEDATSGNDNLSYSQMPSLFWIYYDQAMYLEADSLATYFLSTFPDNTLMIRAQTKLFVIQQRHAEALESAHRLISISENRSKINWSDYFSGIRAVVEVLIAQGETDQAMVYINESFTHDLDSETLSLEWVKKHRQVLQELGNDLVE